VAGVEQRMLKRERVGRAYLDETQLNLDEAIGKSPRSGFVSLEASSIPKL
jgi:hypothetical protein